MALSSRVGQSSARRGALLLWATSWAAVFAAASPARASAEVAALTQDSLPGTIASRELPRGGRLAVYPQPAQPLVCIRLSFELPRGQDAAPAMVAIAQRLVHDDLERLGAFYGARTTVARTTTHATFAITGAAVDFSGLVGVLRQALAPGALNPRAIETARLMAEARARQERETPEPLLRRRLAAGLFPDIAADADTVPVSVTVEALRSFWVRTFNASKLQAVVVGAADPDRAAELIGRVRWGAVPERTALPSGDSAAAPGQADTPGPEPAPADTVRDLPEVLFPWTALGWRSAAEPATLAVAARLVQSQLPLEWLRTAEAELWWAGEHRALVVLGAAANDTLAQQAPAALAGTIAGTLARITPAEVAAARQFVGREMLYSARTPEGMARFLGELFERTGDPAAGQRFLLALDRVDAEEVESALRALADPWFEEVRR